MEIAARRISLQLAPMVNRASPSGPDSDLEFGVEFGACFGSGLGRALREHFARGLSARSLRRREVRPRSVPGLSSDLPSDSEFVGRLTLAADGLL